jgi:hypothetical protein
MTTYDHSDPETERDERDDELSPEELVESQQAADQLRANHCQHVADDDVVKAAKSASELKFRVKAANLRNAYLSSRAGRAADISICVSAHSVTVRQRTKAGVFCDARAPLAELSTVVPSQVLTLKTHTDLFSAFLAEPTNWQALTKHGHGAAEEFVSFEAIPATREADTVRLRVEWGSLQQERPFKLIASDAQVNSPQGIQIAPKMLSKKLRSVMDFAGRGNPALPVEFSGGLVKAGTQDSARILEAKEGELAGASLRLGREQIKQFVQVLRWIRVAPRVVWYLPAR